MTKPTPIHPAHFLLSRAHTPTAAQALFTDRIKNKPLILRPTSPPPSNNRQRRRLERLRKKEYYLRKQKPRPLSAKEKRLSGVHDLKKEQGECKWEVYAGLNQLWKGYIAEVLGIKAGKGVKEGVPTRGNKVVTAQNHGALLASLDYHGADVEVVRCGCVSRVGTKGIVVRDTKFTFVIVTRGDEIRSKLFSLSGYLRQNVYCRLIEDAWADTKSRNHSNTEKGHHFPNRDPSPRR
jgi:ribonuclease P protein subunit POP4